jgi:hypothetical protein
MSGHSEVGPSGLAALIQCPGKVRMERNIPDKTAWVAFEGSVAHEIGENILIKKPSYKVGAVIKKNKHEVTVDQAMIDAVQVYVDHINEIRALGFGTEMVEGKVNLGEFALPEVWGTVDYSYSIPFGTLYVRDYKHGQGVIVSPEENPQMMAYALGAAGSPDVLNSFDEINIGVVQPRGRGGDAVTTWTTTPKELSKWANEVLIPAVTKALSDDAPLNPGEKQCMFCKAKSVCPALADLAMKTAQSDFKDYSDFKPDIPSELSIEEATEIYKNIKVINGFLKSIEARIFNELATGGKVPGYKLVKGRRKRSWSNEAKALEILEKVLGENAYEKKPLTPAKAEKALGKEYKKEIQEFIATDDGKPSIAAADDKKEAISMAEEDFKAYLN